MAKKVKGTGPGGTITPLDGKPSPPVGLTKPRKPISLPSSMLAKSVTPAMLSNGKFQKQMLAFFALHLSPTLFNAVNESMRAGDVSAMRLAADMYGFTQKSGGMNILVNQNNANNTAPREHDDGKSLASFEEIARNVHQNRQRLTTVEAQAVFVETPEE